MNHLKVSKSGKWAVRLGIPADAREAIGKREFKKSLGYLSRPEAEVKAASLIAMWKAQILRVRTASSDPLASSLDELEYSATHQQIVQQAYEQLQNMAGIRNPTPQQVVGRLKDQVDDLISNDEDETLVAAHFGVYCLTSNFLDGYVRDELKGNKSRSIDEHKSVLRNQFIKNFPIIDAKFSQRKVEKWWDTLTKCEKPLSVSTLTKYKSHCSSYMRWLRRKGYTSHQNYFSDLPLNAKRLRKSKADKRKSFTDTELADLWKKLTTQKKRDEPLQELFLLACYTGCRIEELCQLTLSDVKQLQNGRLYLDIPESKTEKGEHRLVPVHSKLNKILQSKTDYLIDVGKVGNKYNERSSAIGKRFGRLKASAGFASDKVFHSIRKSFVDKLRSRNVPEQFAADIVGHEITTITYGLYGSYTPVEELFKYVDAVSYPELEKLLVQDT
jgi:integrase